MNTSNNQYTLELINNLENLLVSIIKLIETINNKKEKSKSHTTRQKKKLEELAETFCLEYSSIYSGIMFDSLVTRLEDQDELTDINLYSEAFDRFFNGVLNDISCRLPEDILKYLKDMLVFKAFEFNIMSIKNLPLASMSNH